MPPMNSYPMSPYMEQPGYVMPQSHLHLVDYRWMLSPQYYHTLAYQSHRLSYQRGSSSRDMISSEVQTEPLTASRKSSAAAAAPASCGGDGVEAHNGFPQGIHDCPERNYPGPAHLLPRAQSAKTGDQLVDLKKTSPSPLKCAPQKSSFVIQTEELRIECCGTAVGLEVLRSRETQETALAHCCAAQDRARCGSVITPSPRLQEVARSAPEEESHIGHQDIVLVGTASCGTTVGTQSVPEPKAQIKRTDASPDSGSRVEVSGGVAQKTTLEQGQKRSNDANVSCGSKDGLFKVLHMPFDLDYLDELRSMSTTVWSMEETVLSSPDWMTQTTLIDSHMETLMEEAKDPRDEDLMDVFAEELPMEQVVPMLEMPQSEEELLIELGSTRDAPPVVALASQPDGLASADVCDTEVASAALLVHPSGVSHSHSSESVVGLPGTGDAVQQELELTDQTSYESLPALLPSTAWPTDCRNIVHSVEVPQTLRKPSKSQSVHNSEVPIERLKLESKEPRAVPRPRAGKSDKANVNRRSVSDHECCLRGNLNENAFPARRPRAERLCSRCLANRNPNSGSDSVQIFKRTCPSSPLQPWLRRCVLPTCDACEVLLMMRRLALRRRSDVCGPSWRDAAGGGGAASENGSCRRAPKWAGPGGDPRRGSADPKGQQVARSRNPERCSLAPTLGERNCACDAHGVPGRDGRSRHLAPGPGNGNARRETNENAAVPVRFPAKWGSMEGNDGYKRKNGGWTFLHRMSS